MIRLPKGLLQRGNIIYIRYYDPQIGRTTTESTKLEANPANIKAAKDLRDAKLKIVKNPTLITASLSQGLKQFLNYKTNYTLKTRLILESATKYFIEACGDLIISNITEYEYLTLQDYWNSKLAVNSRSIYSRSLSAMFNWFVKKKYIQENPITAVPLQRGEVKAIPKDDLDLILTTLKNENLEGYYLIKFLYLTGLRIGEALALKWEDIELDKKLLNFYNAKSKRYDKRPLLVSASELLSEIKLSFPDRKKVFSYTCTSCSFFYRTQARLWGERNIKGNLKTKMLRKYHIHQLRKTFISSLVAQGVAIIDTQVFSGHKDQRTTLNHYVEFQYSQIADRVDKQVNL